MEVVNCFSPLFYRFGGFIAGNFPQRQRRARKDESERAENEDGECKKRVSEQHETVLLHCGGEHAVEDGNEGERDRHAQHKDDCGEDRRLRKIDLCNISRPRAERAQDADLFSLGKDVIGDKADDDEQGDEDHDRAERKKGKADVLLIGFDLIDRIGIIEFGGDRMVVAEGAQGVVEAHFARPAGHEQDLSGTERDGSGGLQILVAEINGGGNILSASTRTVRP